VYRLKIKFLKAMWPIIRYPNYEYSHMVFRNFKGLFLGNRKPTCAAVLAKMFLIFVMTGLFFPLSILFYLSKYRFLLVDVGQIGAYIFLDTFLKEMILQEGKSKIVYIVYSHPCVSANIYLEKLYSGSKHIIILDKLYYFILLLPFANNPVLSKNTFKLDANYKPASIKKIWSRYNEKGHGPLISIPLDDLRECELSLESLGVPRNSKFVALHVRESGYYGDLSKIARNADIFTYGEAIKYLIESGFFIIRLGNHLMSDVSKLVEHFNGRFIDYAHSDIISSKMDCYLMAMCEFLIGSNSGVFTIPPLFNKSICLTNYYPASGAAGFLKNDISIFKKLSKKDDNSLIPLKLLFSGPFSEALQLSSIDKHNLKLVDNTPLEILNAVKDFLFMNPKTVEQGEYHQYVKGLLTENDWAYGADGQYAVSFLSQFNDIP
jgi:putative glycosyltransferase (TIGR04372 family)